MLGALGLTARAVVVGLQLQAMTRKSPLPADVEPDQVWRAPDGQHYKVFAVHHGRATLNRATPGGRVLNTRYQMHESVERMQAEWALAQ
jgi:hypothetical protein